MFFQNVKLMASITMLILLLNSFLLISNIFSIKEVVVDFATKAMFLQITTPGTSEFYKLITALKEDVRLFAGVEWIFILAIYVTSLFSAATTISASAATYRGKDMSIKDLLLGVVKSWKRPSITWFYITLLQSGYLFLTLATLFLFMLMFVGEVFLPAISWIIIIPATVFLSYLAIVWTLAFVVSVMEERCGIDALGKAGELVKGLEMSGFFLNLVFGVLSYVVYQGFRLININQSAVVRLLIVLLVSNSLCLLKVFELMAFTVFYHECKKNKGEETEIHGSLEYTKIPATPPISADMP
ncbi:hypothetical protein FH972_013540 [Carpinus fangiana]|uniref:Transmembrane protein n=1 Tax=Carpinus fangiana TaxID=176857 RepID=A0A5N6R826_9ROSI|nr:hypothetical protein FH972_013540 [Carpinus fangiana]